MYYSCWPTIHDMVAGRGCIENIVVRNTQDIERSVLVHDATLVMSFKLPCSCRSLYCNHIVEFTMSVSLPIGR
jgi:hypothetical protein